MCMHKTLIYTQKSRGWKEIFNLVYIAVGGGGAGGAVAPPFGSKRRKSSKIWANGQFIWANSLDIWAH